MLVQNPPEVNLPIIVQQLGVMREKVQLFEGEVRANDAQYGLEELHLTVAKAGVSLAKARALFSELQASIDLLTEVAETWNAQVRNTPAPSHTQLDYCENYLQHIHEYMALVKRMRAFTPVRNDLHDQASEETEPGSPSGAVAGGQAVASSAAAAGAGTSAAAVADGGSHRPAVACAAGLAAAALTSAGASTGRDGTATVPAQPSGSSASGVQLAGSHLPHRRSDEEDLAPGVVAGPPSPLQLTTQVAYHHLVMRIPLTHPRSGVT